MSLPDLVFITFLNVLTEYFTFILQTQSRKIDIKYHCPSVLYSKSFPSSFSIINFLLGLSKPLLLSPITDDFQSGDMIPYSKHHTYISNCSVYIKQTAQVQFVIKIQYLLNDQTESSTLQIGPCTVLNTWHAFHFSRASVSMHMQTLHTNISPSTCSELAK